MAWQIKKERYYGIRLSGSPDYMVTKEVKRLLASGWEPFCITEERGEVGIYPWIWLKKQDKGVENETN